MATARRVHDIADAATTTDATVTSLHVSSLLATGEVGVVRASIVAKSGTLNAAGWAMEATFKNNAGTVTQVGATLTTLSVQDTALLTATIAFDVTGATFRLRVTGLALTTIDWMIGGRITVC